MSAPQRSWQEILLNRRMVICIFLGFTSGMPLFVLFQLVPAWLRTEGVDLTDIALFSLLSLPYTFKFMWSPLMDRYAPPFLGRRRGWALITQIVLLVVIGALGAFAPAASLGPIAAVVFGLALASASQDIVIDAYRRELLADDELGTGNSIHINAYRLSSLVPGSLALVLSDHLPWGTVFWITGAFMGVGIVNTLLIPEVSNSALAPKTLRSAVVDPFREFFGRRGLRSALAVLALMLLYKLGDSMATALATPFYLDMGYSRTEIGVVAKIAGLWASTAGAVLAGLIMLRLSINRSLWIFGVVQLITILGYAWLSTVEPTRTGLFAVVSAEYLGVGLGTVALTAFLARETSRAFTATQFALFSSIVAVPRTFANATTGFLIEGGSVFGLTVPGLGYTAFFILCTVLAVPGMLMLISVAPWKD